LKLIKALVVGLIGGAVLFSGVYGCKSAFIKAPPPPATQDQPLALGDVGRGKLLYDTLCVTCHDADIHKREGRLVKSYAQLAAEVGRWQGNAGFRWSSTEIQDVTAYLNTVFYRFGCVQGPC
jgi:mono/diheme cytochrome c family protein